MDSTPPSCASEVVGLDQEVELEDARSLSFGAFADELLAIGRGQHIDVRDLLRVQRRFGEMHRDLIGDWAHRADCVVMHGQTLYHAPPLSLQLHDAVWLAAELGIPVCADLRAADIARGGQGAPSRL